MNNLKEGKFVSKYGGSVSYYKGGQLHREDGPAIEWRNGDNQKWIDGELWRDGDTEWWVNGKLHREDGPAIEWMDGTQMWFVNGKKHRLDGPAIDYASGHKEWWIDEVQYSEEDFDKEISKLNKGKTSAVRIDALGTKRWHRNLKLHREDGPAVEYFNGDKEWFINGVQYSEAEFNALCQEPSRSNKAKM